MKTLVAIVAAAGFLVSTSAFAAGEEELAKSKGCMACHKIDSKAIGPSYKDVAAKYAGQKDAVAKLAEKVINGGSGVWGKIPMSKNAHVTPEDAKKLVTWVLSLK